MTYKNIFATSYFQKVTILIWIRNCRMVGYHGILMILLIELLILFYEVHLFWIDGANISLCGGKKNAFLIEF